MKKEFIGYYLPSDDEFGRLWKEGVVVLDTNVLLDLYRLPDSARDEIIEVLRTLRERIWIPYQVALEFQRRRLTVIGSERKSTEDALSSANDMITQVCDKVSSLQIDKRGLGLDAKPLLDGIRSANEKLTEAIKSVHKSQLDISVTDSVRNKLDEILDGKVGASPVDQAELDTLTLDGQDRYDKKIPPGFADSDKDKNPNEAIFYHDGFAYHRKFGDLILWRQLINHAKDKGIKKVLLVTSDRKDDWWWKEKGKTIGPRPELAREINKEAGVDLFWMYSSSQFLENAKRYIKADVSDLSVTELEAVSRVRPLEEHRQNRFIKFKEEYNIFNERRDRIRRISILIRNWLEERFVFFVESADGLGFPDFVVLDDGNPHGFEVKEVRSLNFIPPVRDALMKGHIEVKEGRLSKFSLILVFDKISIDKMIDADNGKALRKRLQQMLLRYEGNQVIYGFIDEKSNDFINVENISAENDNSEEWEV